MRSLSMSKGFGSKWTAFNISKPRSCGNVSHVRWRNNKEQETNKNGNRNNHTNLLYVSDQCYSAHPERISLPFGFDTVIWNHQSDYNFQPISPVHFSLERPQPQETTRSCSRRPKSVHRMDKRNKYTDQLTQTHLLGRIKVSLIPH